MEKSLSYFPHFSNARSDSKILRLRRLLSFEGYAIYFMLLEVLREQTDFKYPLDMIDELCFDFRTEREKVMAVINNFDLFDIDDAGKFFSPKQIFYLMPYIEKSERAKAAAEIRWGKVKALKSANVDANAMQMHSKCNTNADASKNA